MFYILIVMTILLIYGAANSFVEILPYLGYLMLFYVWLFSVVIYSTWIGREQLIKVNRKNT